MDPKRFERLVADVFDTLPDWVHGKLGNLAVVLEGRPSRGLCKQMGIDYEEGLLGLYEGPSLLERDPAAMEGPSRVILYRQMIEDEARDEADLARVIRETLVHEIGHHFGMTEAEMEEFERAWEEKI